jgi:hypothetical protein
MRRRWPGIPDTKFIGATNPGEVGHLWVRKFWIDRDFQDEQYDAHDFAFVPAKYSDNKFLPENYGKQLDALPEKLRRAYKDGDWDIFEGQFFNEFSKEKHVVEPFAIPKGWTRILGVDYGNKNPSGVLWCAIDYDGHLWIYRELYEAGHTYAELADRIRLLTADDEQIEYAAADTSMFAKTLDTGKYGHDIMADHGVPLTQANKDRIPGWNLVREHLKNGTLHIFSTCSQLIRTLPAMVHDCVHVEDVQKNDSDHLCDSLRYLIFSLPEASKEGKKEPQPEPMYKDDKNAPWNKKEKDSSYNNLYSY